MLFTRMKVTVLKICGETHKQLQWKLKMTWKDNLVCHELLELNRIRCWQNSVLTRVFGHAEMWKQRNFSFSFQYSGDNLIKLNLFRPDQEKANTWVRYGRFQRTVRLVSTSTRSFLYKRRNRKIEIKVRKENCVCCGTEEVSNGCQWCYRNTLNCSKNIMKVLIKWKSWLVVISFLMTFLKWSRVVYTVTDTPSSISTYILLLNDNVHYSI